LKLSISFFDDDDKELKIVASSYLDEIGLPSSVYSIISYENSTQEDEVDIIILQEKEKPYTITIVRPVNLAGQIVGTYEMIFSMDSTYAILDTHSNYLLLISIVSLFVLIFLFLYLLRRVIVRPVMVVRDAAKKVAKGNMNTQVNISSHDELGELAADFNQMTIDLKTSRDKIKRYSKTLEKLLKQKDEFIGQLGHDLKNPLQPLVGLLPMIHDQEKDPRLKKQLHLIVNNVEYMRDLIFETLELARLRSSDIKFDKKNINLLETVSSVLEKQELFLKEHNVTVENSVNQEIFVLADRLRLEELFHNLIANAVKYIPKKSGMISINANKQKDIVTVSVKDNGIGMTKEQLDRIFDEFYMADESRRKIDSSGLGLPISKRIVEKHGGKIWVESPGPGKGSTFFFTLKAGKANKDKSDIEIG
jgi:signal transduction histidine kinase